MKNIIYISDFFIDELLGGAELSDDTVIRFIESKGYNVKTIKSQTFNPIIHKADTFIISNFTGLSEINKSWFISTGAKYIIIERDQKYVRSRNTVMYKDFIAPQSEVVNKTFYRCASKVYCLTNHATELLLKHIDLINVESLGCSQFSQHQFNIIRKNIGKNKNNKFAIISGKRSNKAIQYCEVNKLDYDIIENTDYDNFIETFSNYKGIVFFSHMIESCCRLLVEARMLEMKIITDNQNGCTYEDWFKNTKGEELVDYLEIKVNSILEKIEKQLSVKHKVHIFVGEFSYAMNWHAPRLHSECIVNNSYNTIVTLPAYSMLYRKFADEVHALPEHIYSRLGRLATIGENISPISDITPGYIIDYCKQKYPDAEIIIPTYINPFEQTPPGVYQHLTPSDGVKDDIVKFLSGFDKQNTITVFPKFRGKGGGDGVQNWLVDNWYSLIQTLLDKNYNVVVLKINDSTNAQGGTYDLNINDDRVRVYNVDRDDEYALDRQAWILTLTRCSIYGSTGAASFPHWIDTPSCSIMHIQYGHRLSFEWQKRLTDNHNKNKIIILDDLSVFNFHEIEELITQYIIIEYIP